MKRIRKNLHIKKPTALPPHDPSLYRKTLEILASRHDELVIKPLGELLNGGKNEWLANIYLRHDVDFYPLSLRALCSIEYGLGLTSSIYVLVAKEEFFEAPYDPMSFRAMFDELKSMGFEIGLHSVAWTVETKDMLKCFSQENEIFERTFGYLPESFTFHGYPFHRKHRDIKRKVFSQELTAQRYRYEHLSGKMSDYFLKPSVGVSDSGIPWPKGENEVRHFFPGEIVCILNHPCFWSEEGYEFYKKRVQPSTKQRPPS
jgi:hypothetical protein